jgi:hypothetical protein
MDILIWQAMDQSAYAWGALKKLPEEVRDKKEPPARAQLGRDHGIPRRRLDQASV